MNGGDKIKMIVVSEEKEADGWAGAHRPRNALPSPR